MSRGQRKRGVRNFPRMKFRGRKRFLRACLPDVTDHMARNLCDPLGLPRSTAENLARIYLAELECASRGSRSGTGRS